MNPSNSIEPIEIFAGTIMQCEMVKSLLENAEIETYLKDEINGTIVPWVTSPGGVNSVKVIVSSVDYEKAMQVVQEYEKNVKD